MPVKRAKRVQEIGEDVDWWITEKPDEARSLETGTKITDTEEFPEPIKLSMPIRRYCDEIEVTVEIKEPVTLPQILERIWRFYHEDPIAPEHVWNEENDDDDSYGKDAKCYLEFMTGCPEQGRGSGDNKGTPFDTDSPNRHPFMCSGLIRFEGLTLRDGVYVLSLGS